MDNIIKVKHSFNCGDLVTILYGLRSLYRKTGKKIAIYQRINLQSQYYIGNVISTTDNNGDSVSMNLDLFNRMKPIIESQDYIYSMEVWEGQEVDFDYDLTRDSRSIPMPNALLQTWGEAVFPQTSANLAEQILFVEPLVDSIYKNKVIINRTQRYVNPYITYYFLKKFQDKCIFSGTEVEHKDFCEKFNLDIEYLKTDNFYQLAQIIQLCKFGVYNQSLHFHIADGLKTKRVLELCQPYPNTFCMGANGYHAYRQQALEYYFETLLNE
tara:strand:+ start:3042 stop:3848 length:807 start_codon:yes stop_codon:yes gene_type:complete